MKTIELLKEALNPNYRAKDDKSSKRSKKLNENFPIFSTIPQSEFDSFISSFETEDAPLIRKYLISQSQNFGIPSSVVEEFLDAQSFSNLVQLLDAVLLSKRQIPSMFSFRLNPILGTHHKPHKPHKPEELQEPEEPEESEESEEPTDIEEPEELTDIEEPVEPTEPVVTERKRRK